MLDPDCLDRRNCKIACTAQSHAAWLHKRINLHGTSDTACTKVVDGLLADLQKEQHGCDCQQHCCMFYAIAYICSCELGGSISRADQAIIVCTACMYLVL